MGGKKGVGGARGEGSPRCSFSMELTGCPGSQDPHGISVATLHDKLVMYIHVSWMIAFLPSDRLSKKFKQRTAASHNCLH